ncbi:hypothetical protein HZB90_02415 [archaeon]|nr:hypothetical protein [archaeon]
MTEESNLCRALSGVRDWDFELRQDRSGMFAASLFCRSADDVGNIMEAYGELFRNNTRVFLRQGSKKQLIGELSDVISGRSRVATPEEEAYDIPIFLDEEVDDDEVELDIGDLADVVELSDRSEKSKRFYESAVYQDIFKMRDELGLSIDYYKDRHGNSQFRYRRKPKEGVSGKWVSKDYVHEAVCAIREYDSIIKKGDWKSLRRAETIAEKYFTEEGKAKSRERVSKMLDQKAVSLSCYAAGGLIDERTAKQVYSRLVMTRSVENLMGAVAIAKRYLPDDVADATERYLNRVSEQEYERFGIVRLDAGVPENKASVAQPPQQVHERQFFFLAA